MKKKISLILSLVLCITSVAFVSSCGSNTDTNTNTNGNTETDTSIVNTETDSSTDTSTDSQKPSTDTSTDSSTGSSTDTSTDSGLVPDPGVDTPPVEDGMNLEQLLTAHPEEALAFAQEQISAMSNYDDMKSVAYSFEETDGKITKINVAYVVPTAEDSTERKLMKAEINVVDGVEIQDIADGNLGNITTATETTQTLLTFDAKEEYNKGSESTIASDINFAITTALGEDATAIKDYQIEDFEVKSVAEWADQNAVEINAKLSEKCLDKIVNDCYFGMYTKDQIKTGKWILEGDTEITGLKLLCEVYNDENTAQLQVVDINIKQPMQLYKNMDLSNIEISSVMLDYNLGYKIADRNARVDLIDALFKAAGVNEVGGERYLKVIGSSIVSDFGQTTEFVICEVGESDIKEFTINILSTYGVTTDEEYILKLKDSSNFKIYSPKEIDISGAKVDYVPSES